MRFMMLVKASKNCEAGGLPDEKILSEMRKYNEELVKAGALLAADGLQASSKGARVRYSKGKYAVIDGPFAETKELIAGFWIWQVSAREEVIEWVRTGPVKDDELEIRQVFSADDVGDARAPELREPEDRLRAAGVGRHGA